jgi:hypothetical protein
MRQRASLIVANCPVPSQNPIRAASMADGGEVGQHPSG